MWAFVFLCWVIEWRAQKNSTLDKSTNTLWTHLTLGSSATNHALQLNRSWQIWTRRVCLFADPTLVSRLVVRGLMVRSTADGRLRSSTHTGSRLWLASKIWNYDARYSLSIKACEKFLFGNSIAKTIQLPILPALYHKFLHFEAKGFQWFGHIQTCSSRFSKVRGYLNLGPNVMFGSSCSPNSELNFGQVQRGSGSNQGSEPNCGSTSMNRWRLNWRCVCC